MVPFSRLCRGLCMSSSSSFSFVASLCRRTPDDFNGSSFPSPFHPRSPQFKWALRCFPVCRYRTSSSSSSSSWSFCLSLFPVSSSRRAQLPSHRYALGFASPYLVNCQLFLPLLPLPLLFSSILWRVSARPVSMCPAVSSTPFPAPHVTDRLFHICSQLFLLFLFCSARAVTCRCLLRCRARCVRYPHGVTCSVRLHTRRGCRDGMEAGGSFFGHPSSQLRRVMWFCECFVLTDALPFAPLSLTYLLLRVLDPLLSTCQLWHVKFSL